MANQEEKILQELGLLKETVNQLRERLEALEDVRKFERRVGVAPSAVYQPSEPALRGAPPEPSPYQPAAVIEKGEFFARRPLETLKGEEAASSFYPEKKSVDFEEVMRKWLPRVGMLAILFGAGFFLKYAFENGWIGPVGQVIIGLLAGIGFLGGGEYFETKKEQHSLARLLTGGGLALLYFSLFAARSAYDEPLLTSATAFVAMLFVTIAAGFFSVRYNSQLVAFFGIIGAFLTPFLIGSSEPTRVNLLWYMLLLDAGILGLAFFKNWRELNFAAFIFTVFSYAATYFYKFGATEPLFVSFNFLTFYFLIFSFAAFVYNIVYQMPTRKEDIYLILFNPAFYYGFSYYLLASDYDNLLGLFSFGIAVFYVILAYLAFWRNPEDKFLPLSFLGICAGFVAAGIALQWDQYWVTIFWTVEAFILLWIGFQIKDYLGKAYTARVFGLALFILAFIKIFFFDSWLGSAEFFTPIFNKRFLVYFIFVPALFGAGALYSYYKERIREAEKYIIYVLNGAANFLIVFLISLEIIDYFEFKKESLSSGISSYDYDSPLYNYDNKRFASLNYQMNAALSTAWALYSVLLLVIGIAKKNRPARLMAMTLFGVTILKVFIWDLSYLAGFSRILSFIILGLILLGVGYIYNKYKDKIREIV